MKNILIKLNEIQKKLKAPKNQLNSFSHFNYRSCEDILEAVKPLLGDMTLILTDEIILVGNRYYVKATVKLNDGEEFIEVNALAREPEIKKGFDESQITGASSSYARKYALNGLFLIDDTKDADTADNLAIKQITAKKAISTVNPVVASVNYKIAEENKSWIDDKIFYEAINKLLTLGKITAETPVEEVMRILRIKYKVAKKYQELISKDILLAISNARRNKQSEAYN